MEIYHISTLQALMMGYTRSVVTVKELLKHGDIQGQGQVKNNELPAMSIKAIAGILLSIASIAGF